MNDLTSNASLHYLMNY